MSLRQQLLRLAHQEAPLRQFLVPLLRRANLKCQKVSGGDRASYLDSVWGMYQTTYRDIGTGVASPQGLFKYDLWSLCLDNQGTPKAFTLSVHTPYGLKTGLSGFDGSPEGKAQALISLKARFHEPGVYSEVSHKIEAIAVAVGAPVICARDAGTILKKPIVLLEDGVHYQRNLTGVGRVTKMMVGRPKGVATTNIRNPQCSTERLDSLATQFDDSDDVDVHAHLASLVYSHLI